VDKNDFENHKNENDWQFAKTVMVVA